MLTVKERQLQVRKALTIRGCTFPKRAGVIREEHITQIDPALAKIKTQVTYSLTTEQYVIIKNRGGSAFLRDLIDWFVKQESKSIANALDGGGSGTFSFNGYPVLLDIDAQKPMWETYFWAKEHDCNLDKLNKDMRDAAR